MRVLSLEGWGESQGNSYQLIIKNSTVIKKKADCRKLTADS